MGDTNDGDTRAEMRRRRIAWLNAQSRRDPQRIVEAMKAEGLYARSTYWKDCGTVFEFLYQLREGQD